MLTRAYPKGVLTKPDTIPAGSTGKLQQWIEIMAGREHPTRHGYFCIRQPDDAERAKGISAAAARDAENHFFETVTPWATLSCRERLGTDNLLRTMSGLLSQMTQAS